MQNTEHRDEPEMSKGLSKRQREILALLRRKHIPNIVTSDAPDGNDVPEGAMSTRAIVEALFDAASEQRMFVVRRALESLQRRGLVAGVRAHEWFDDEHKQPSVSIFWYPTATKGEQ